MMRNAKAAFEANTETASQAEAMAAGVSTKLWDVADLVDLLIESESKKAA